MSSLDEARARIEARRASQPQGGGGQELWMRKDDLVVAHAIFTGAENDPYFETFVVHEYPATGQGKYPTNTYCPVESGHDGNYDCPGCRDGIKTKDRMIMWFWVYDILHTTMKQGESFEQVPYLGKTYFRREINGPRYWNTSAWAQSCLDDILMIGQQLKKVDPERPMWASMYNINCLGDNRERRYKFYIAQGSQPFDESLLASAETQPVPVIDVLMASLQQTPVQANPNTGNGSAPAPEPTIVKPYTPGSGSGSTSTYTPKTDVKPYTPGGAAATGAKKTTKKGQF